EGSRVPKDSVKWRSFAITRQDDTIWWKDLLLMKSQLWYLPVLSLLLIIGCAQRQKPKMETSAALEPPPAPREFRDARVATDGHIDWPSKPGLSSSEQKA